MNISPAAALFSLLLVLPAAALRSAPDARLVSPGESDWHPPSNLPPGAEYVLIAEDPVTHGIQALVRFPSGYGVPSHSHTCTETLVVISGRLEVEMDGKKTVLKAGDFAVFPAGKEHSLKARGWRRAVFTATTNAAYDLKPADRPLR